MLKFKKNNSGVKMLRLSRKSLHARPRTCIELKFREVLLPPQTIAIHTAHAFSIIICWIRNTTDSFRTFLLLQSKVVVCSFLFLNFSLLPKVLLTSTLATAFIKISCGFPQYIHVAVRALYYLKTFKELQGLSDQHSADHSPTF